MPRSALIKPCQSSCVGVCVSVRCPVYTDLQHKSSNVWGWNWLYSLLCYNKDAVLHHFNWQFDEKTATEEKIRKNPPFEIMPIVGEKKTQKMPKLTDEKNPDSLGSVRENVYNDISFEKTLYLPLILFLSLKWFCAMVMAFLETNLPSILQKHSNIAYNMRLDWKAEGDR